MESSPAIRIQICGPVTVAVGGRRCEDALPSRQGRLLFAYLVVHRRRPAAREELVRALWGERPPHAADAALSALLSKLRRALGADLVRGRDAPRLVLPPDAFVDLEAAGDALHRAESAVALGEWARAWGPCRVALHTSERPFLQGHDAPWIDDVRRSLEAMRLRALECTAAVGLGLGGPEVAATERAGRRLVELAPFRESGHAFLMEALERRGDVAEALRAYEDLRRLLREELGIAPAPEMQERHARLLRSR